MANAASTGDGVSALRDWRAEAPRPRPVSPPEFALEVFLEELVEALPGTDNDHWFRILDRFCKKIDVLGKLHCCYTEDLSKPVGATRLNEAYLPAMAGILLHWAEARRDIKFLNSALKLLAFEEFASFPGERRLFAARAQQLVGELARLR